MNYKIQYVHGAQELHGKWDSASEKDAGIEQKSFTKTKKLTPI